MKMKVDDLRTKFKKGRINFEEFEMQFKKLETHYKCKIDEIYPEETVVAKNQSNRIEDNYKDDYKVEKDYQTKNVPNEQNFEEDKNVHDIIPKNRSVVNSGTFSSETYGKNSSPHEIPNSRPNPSQFYPYPNSHSQFSASPYPIQQQQQQQQLNGMSEAQMGMMLKLFEELKGIIHIQSESQRSLMDDKKILQETLSKMSPYLNQNQILLTQPVPTSVTNEIQK